MRDCGKKKCGWIDEKCYHFVIHSNLSIAILTTPHELQEFIHNLKALLYWDAAHIKAL
jgi:hypothetical protein